MQLSVKRAILCLSLGASLILPSVSNAECTISSTVGSQTSQRRVPLSVTCPGATQFVLSESNTYKQNSSEGVSIRIDSVAADRSYADISITYPNGVTGSGGTPFALSPITKDVKTLVVLYTFEGVDGSTAGLPTYLTTTWLNRLIFGGDSVSFDGRTVDNSFARHVEQSTWGRLRLTGEVYPEVIRISLEKFRAAATGATDPNIDLEVLNAIRAKSPGYLENGGFEMLLAVSPDQYAVKRSLYYHSSQQVVDSKQLPIRSSLSYSLPIGSGSILTGPITDTRTSSDASTVVTRYNPGAVTGVWLQSDTAKTGTNYFTGGSIVWNTAIQYATIKLGTPLPAANTAVTVSYTSSNAGIISIIAAPDKTSPGNWFGHMMHEFYHDISTVPGTAQTERKGIGDLYMNPARVNAYDLMASGNNNAATLPTGQYYQEPSLFSAYQRLVLGYARPLTLTFGQSESALRLHRAEISSPSALGQETRMIKIPLHPIGDEGAAVLQGTYGAAQFEGREYLLLEWRSKGALAAGGYNFDAALPSEGLAIYRVIEAGVDELTGHGNDVARIVDATPPDNFDGFTDTSASPALFGPGSGVLNYVAGEFPQEKKTDSQNVNFLLSPGAGTKTIFARFIGSGAVIGEAQLALTLTSDEQPLQRLPHVTLTGLSEGQIIPNGSYAIVKISTQAPNGVKFLQTYIDNVRKYSMPATASTQDFLSGASLSPGSHNFRARVIDNGLYEESVSVNFTMGSPVTVTVTPTPAPTSSPVPSPVPTSSPVPTVTVAPTPVPSPNPLPTPAPQLIVLVAPSSLQGAATSSGVRLAWTDNSTGEDGFYVERGTSKKGNVSYSQIGIASAGVATFNDTVRRGTYFYRVRAFKTGFGVSGYSNVISVQR